MLKYDFKKFFSENGYRNNEYITNGHFIIKNSILTKSELNFTNKHVTEDDNKIQTIASYLARSEDKFNEVSNRIEFKPTHFIKGEKYNMIHDSNSDVNLNEEYFNMLQSKQCKIYKIDTGRTFPFAIVKDNEFVGIALPIYNIREYDNKISYSDYITEIKRQQAEQEEINKLNKKCLYTSDNKAVVRNKPLKCLADVTGVEKYNNLYIELNSIDNYTELYIDLGIVCISANKGVRVDLKPEDYEYYLNGYSHITLDFYINYIKENIKNKKWINVAEIKLLELAGEPEGLIKESHKVRKHIREQQEQKRLEEQNKMEQEYKEYLENKIKIVAEEVAKAEESILKGEIIRNKDIDVYNSRYDYNTTSLILYIMKQYDIKVPLKTQGWINAALYSIKPDTHSLGEYTYNYHTSSKDSTVFYKYLNILVEKVKEKYKNVA